MNQPVRHMNRAYAILDVRSADDSDPEKRIIRGIATTPTPDRLGDVIVPEGIVFADKMPLLWMHRHDKPVGWAMFRKPTKKGIDFDAELADVPEPGPLHDRIEEAWQSVKAGLVCAVSIGFRALEHEPLDQKVPWGPQRFTKSEVLELSLVTIPANAEATITAIKSIDDELRAASGPSSRLPVVRLSPPGVSGPALRKPQEREMKTLADQITAFENTRAAKAARLSEIMEKSIEESRSTDEAEQDEFDGLEREIEAIDADLKRLSTAQRFAIKDAKPIERVTNSQQAAEVRGRAAVLVKQNMPKGTSFTRYVMALARSNGNIMQAVEISKQWQDTPEVETILRAAVTAGTTADADWAKPLVEYRVMADEFIELLRPATILGRVPGLRRVPFMVKIPVQTQGSLVNWVGETLPKPVGELKFASITLEMSKVAGIVVLSEELVRLSTPSAEGVVRTDLVSQIAQFLDLEFIDPANAAVAGVSPASILNGVAGIPSGGTTADDARNDVQALFGAFISANLGVGDAVWITTETIALQLGMMLNPLGQPEFAGLGPTGGTYQGLPMITSQSVPAGVLALVKASEILLADEGGVTIDSSREATLAMDNAPAAGAVATFNLWQNNCIAIKAERFINWRRRRDQAVAYLTGVDYSNATP